MLLSEKPITRASGYIAKSVIRELEVSLSPTRLDGLASVWQVGGAVGKNFWTATIIQTA
jgi:hypothetical protein